MLKFGVWGEEAFLLQNKNYFFMEKLWEFLKPWCINFPAIKLHGKQQWKLTFDNRINITLFSAGIKQVTSSPATAKPYVVPMKHFSGSLGRQNANHIK